MIASFVHGIGPVAGPALGLAMSKTQKQPSMGGQAGGGGQPSFGGFQQQSAEFRPSQTGPGAPSISTGPGEGASGGTGALGGQPVGTAVDKLRATGILGPGNPEEASKGFYGLRVGR